MNASDDTTGGAAGGGTPSYDDLNFGRARTPGYQDNDAGMAAMLAAAAATPDSKHQEDEDAMRRYLASDDAKLVLGQAAATPLLVESPEVFRELTKADPAQDAVAAVTDAADRALQASQAEQAALTAAEAARGAGGPAGSNTGSGSAPTRPMELEKQIANIQMSKDRELRMVIQGDEALKIKFYAKLEGMGKLRYQGGTPVINMSMRGMAKVLQDVARDNGAVFQPVAQLEFNRAGNGLMQRMAGGVKDMLGRQHQVAIYAVGDQATVNKKVAEISTVLQKFTKDGLLADTGDKNFKDGQLMLDPDKLVELKGSKMLDDLVGQARATVQVSKAYDQARDQARKDYNNQKVDDMIAKQKAGVGNEGEAGSAKASTSAPSTAGTAAGSLAASSAPQTPISPYVQKLKDGMADGFSEAGKLSVQPEGKKQITAEILLNQARTFNAKDVGELNKLSPVDRQTLFTQLALTTAMADTGTFGKKLTSETIDKAYEADPARNKAASPSIRSKVGELIAAERGDPQFENRAAAVLNDLELKNIITREHATKAFETLAPGKELPVPTKDAAQAIPEADAKAQTGAATAGASQGSSPVAPAVPTELRTLGVSQAEFAEALPRIQESLKGVAPDVAEALKKVAENIPRASSREDEVDIWKQGQAALAKLSPEATSKLEGAIQAQITPKAPSPSLEESAPAGATLRSSGTQPAPEAAAVGPVKASQPGVSPATASDTVASSMAPDLAATKPAVPTSALVEKIDALVKAGPAALSREDASSVVASLEGRQASKLASLDGRGGNLPTQTLERIDGLLKEVASGRHGDDLAASAKNLVDAVEKWKGQDAQRLSKDHGLSPDALEALRGSLRKEAGAWHGVGKEAAPPAEIKAASSAQAGVRVEGGKPAEKAPGLEAGSSASDGQKAAAAERYSQTELAAGKLAAMMNNPPGAFTNKDKSWNERNVEAAANAVMRLDVDSVRTMSSNQRNQIAAYSAWVADNANSGRLPGFTGPEGQARAQALTVRATALVGTASGKMPAGVTAQLTKADRMVGALQQRAMAAPRRASSAVRAGIPSSGRTSTASQALKPTASAAASVDGVRLARDLGHAVFKESSLSEPYAKYLLKNAGALTADSVKSLSPTEKAQAAVGLAHLALEVRSGAMGDFKDLSPTLQRQVVSAQQVANKLQTELSANPDNRTALAKAFMDLQAPASEKSQPAAQQAGSKGAEHPALKPPEAGVSRSMER